MFGSKGGRAERKKQSYYTSRHFKFVPTIFDGRDTGARRQTQRTTTFEVGYEAILTSAMSTRGATISKVPPASSVRQRD